MPSPTSTRATERAARVLPLLKWVGGKRQLLPRIRPFYPPTFGSYFEPFFGSGAVFLDLWSAGHLRGRRAVLLDSNSDLVGCYEMVRDRTSEVLGALRALAGEHARLGRAHYYAVRDERFNPLRDARREADGRIPYSAELAAMLIYLNRTGFNGLYRVNARGHFNVPAGRHVRPNIADRPRLERVAAVLQDSAVALRRAPFTEALDLARPGDFLYFDPPYAPLSVTASFTSYTALGFGAEDQRTLQCLVIALAERGCHVLLSNSTSDVIGALYDGNREAEAAGLRTYRVRARRAVNSVATRRGAVDEFLISNIEPR
ncbi:MAG: Dam family site-specific DNA-(adenine-N6)-methyltransferase [Acidimicrobiia bacterium]|nr:Dam family site-specific DNA-(adenine-N6)-methyltransferase [Acidimicrobiia bacterium]